MNMRKPETLEALHTHTHTHTSSLNKNKKYNIGGRENYVNMLFNIRSKHNALFSCVKNSSLRNYIKVISKDEEAVVA